MSLLETNQTIIHMNGQRYKVMPINWGTSYKVEHWLRQHGQWYAVPRGTPAYFAAIAATKF